MSPDGGITPQDARSAIPAPRREPEQFWSPTAPGPGRGSTELPPLRLPEENPNLLHATPRAVTLIPQGCRLRTVDLGALAAPEDTGRSGCQILAASRQDTAPARADFEDAVAQNLAMLAAEVAR